MLFVSMLGMEWDFVSFLGTVFDRKRLRKREKAR